LDRGLVPAADCDVHALGSQRGRAGSPEALRRGRHRGPSACDSEVHAPPTREVARSGDHVCAYPTRTVIPGGIAAAACLWNARHGLPQGSALWVDSESTEGLRKEARSDPYEESHARRVAASMPARSAESTLSACPALDSSSNGRSPSSSRSR